MEQRIKDILLAPYHNPDFYWDTPDLEKATASLLQLIREAQIDVVKQLISRLPYALDNHVKVSTVDNHSYNVALNNCRRTLKQAIVELKAKESE